MKLLKRIAERRKARKTIITNLSQGRGLLNEIDIQNAVYKRKQYLAMRRSGNVLITSE